MYRGEYSQEDDYKLKLAASTIFLGMNVSTTLVMRNLC
jgi:hypothetical protein